MFEQNPNGQNPSQPQAPQPQMPQSPQVDDIFSQTDIQAGQTPRPMASPAPASAPSELRRGEPAQPQSSYRPGPMPQPISTEELFGGRSIWQNKFLIAGLVILALAIVGGGVFGAITLMKTKPNQPTNQNNNAAVNQNTNTETNTNAATTTNPVVDETKDSDADGLTDVEETRLGTDPNNFDTDGDGLIDKMEVQVYKTDPLKSDTDGDGYKDGEEVLNGYDPTKPGNARLYQVPQP